MWQQEGKLELGASWASPLLKLSQLIPTFAPRGEPASYSWYSVILGQLFSDRISWVSPCLLQEATLDSHCHSLSPLQAGSGMVEE